MGRQYMKQGLNDVYYVLLKILTPVMPDRVIQMICVGFINLYAYISVDHVQCRFIVERQIERDTVSNPWNPC